MTFTKTQRAAAAGLVISAGFFLSGVVGAAIDVDGDREPVGRVPQIAAGWSQCGGYEYSGPTECEEGFYCHKNHDSYHQCWLATTVKITPTAAQAMFTRPPAASPEPTTPSLPPRTRDLGEDDGL